MFTNARVALPETQQTQQQARRRYEIKCPAPAEASTNQSANNIAECAADRNGRVKDRHDATAFFDREKVGQDCRCCRAVAAFANSNANSSRKENGECRRQTGAAAGQAPQNHSGTDDDPARESIGKQTENRCADHVSYKKRVAEQTGLRHSVYVVRRKKTGANIRLERSQNLPIDIIKQIDPEQEQKRTVRAANRFLHATFHRQWAIADGHALIVTDKQWLPCPPLSARCISLRGHRCAAFIVSRHTG